jgi:hypothetical protein
MYSQWDNSTWHLHSSDNPTWNSPDIWLEDANGNEVNSNDLTLGDTYRIVAKVRNDTLFDATNTKVTFKWANFGVGQPDRVWNKIGIDPVTLDVAKQSVAEVSIPFTTPLPGHLCLMVEVFHVEDIVSRNNRGQENLHVGETSSPTRIPFTIWNPTNVDTAVHLEVRQLIPPSQQQTMPIWATRIEHPKPQIIPAAESRQAWIVIDPEPAVIDEGEQAEFALTAFINGHIVGGANFIIVKK